MWHRRAREVATLRYRREHRPGQNCNLRGKEETNPTVREPGPPAGQPLERTRPHPDFSRPNPTRNPALPIRPRLGGGVRRMVEGHTAKDTSVGNAVAPPRPGPLGPHQGGTTQARQLDSRGKSPGKADPDRVPQSGIACCHGSCSTFVSRELGFQRPFASSDLGLQRTVACISCRARTADAASVQRNNRSRTSARDNNLAISANVLM